MSRCVFIYLDLVVSLKASTRSSSLAWSLTTASLALFFWHAFLALPHSSFSSESMVQRDLIEIQPSRQLGYGLGLVIRGLIGGRIGGVPLPKIERKMSERYHFFLILYGKAKKDIAT